ncbi:MAG: hypothetical protein KJP25_02060 [Gammaproteobacteria bacterium]|nr:hypothetical protein [Gammaproteobacteria bacterium]NNL11911.1 hypothetical protein [Pseudomonadales bacterium]NNM11781.1 hypothetical protein [Pseudomonadales bacterium]RZV54166.1 MAG: hypothetical protein EX270_07875 [Pseudomonadales bacterium]
MASADDFTGSINQALYFSRLLIEQARSLQQEAGDAAFARQRSRCFSEASIDALYRALVFLVLAELQRAGIAASQNPRLPEELVQELEAAARLHPTPMLNRLRAALHNGQPLQMMLQAWRELWVVRAVQPVRQDLLHSAPALSPADCQAWREQINALFAAAQEQGAEY